MTIFYDHNADAKKRAGFPVRPGSAGPSSVAEDYLSAMARLGSWVQPGNGISFITSGDTDPLALAQNMRNASQLYLACKDAALGNTRKRFDDAVAVGAAPTVVSLADDPEKPFFGFYFRLSDSPLDWDYSVVPVTVIFNNEAARTFATRLGTSGCLIEARYLAIQSSAGQASVAKATRLSVSIDADAIPAGARLYVETLTQRDLNTLRGQIP